MKNKTVNARLVWKQLEDEMVPRLRLSVIDRVVYAHLLRHSRLEGRPRLRFSMVWLARGIRVSVSPARLAVRRLVEHGALRLVERTKAGHVVEVRLPAEIRAARPDAIREGNGGPAGGTASLEETDFMRSRALRQSIHARERGRCFYCLRRTRARMQCLDHVVPQVEMGRNSYRNLVSCCSECNSKKGESTAGNFLRWLFREGKLTSEELKGRMRALEKVAKGGMTPEVRR
jgi:5-methylcytosine-specific restriction endonuclease McrA